MKKLSFRHTIASCYIGAVVQAVVCGYLPLLYIIFCREYGIPLVHITLLATVNFVTQLTTDSLAIFFVEKTGYRRAGLIGYAMVFLGLLSLGYAPFVCQNLYGWILLSVIMFSIGGGLMEVLLSPIVEACPTKNKPAAMSMLHSMFGFGSGFVILFTTALLAVFGWESWGFITLFWAAIPLLNGIYFCFVPINDMTKRKERTSKLVMLKDIRFWGFILVMAAGGAAEIGMSQWASAFAESSLGVSKTVGDILGPCTFAFMMAFARVLYSKLSDKIDLSTYILISGVLTCICYLAAALVPISMVALIACGLCGFTVGVMWPGTLSLASKDYPLGGAPLFALLAMAGDVGCTLGPTAVGLAASIFGGELKTGLLVGTVFPLLLVVGLISLNRKKAE